MKRCMMVPLTVLLLAPLAAAAQVEVGIDAGLRYDSRSVGDGLTQLNVPAPSVRIGFPRGRFSFETPLSVNVLASGGTLTVIDARPGLNIGIGSGGAYLRPEGVMLLASGGGDTESEFGAGGALGFKNAVAGSPVSFRFEVGFDRLFDAGMNQFRLLFGLSTELGG